jgi:hypothetical protein
MREQGAGRPRAGGGIGLSGGEQGGTCLRSFIAILTIASNARIWAGTPLRTRCPRPNANTRRTTASRRSTPASRRAVRQSARPARKKPRGSVGRRTQREGDRHRERQTPPGHQARGGHRPAGQQLGLGRVAGHQDADRHDPGHREKAEPAAAENNSFSPTDKEVVQQLIARLRRDLCNGCPWAAQRAGLDSRSKGTDTEDAGQAPLAA